MMHIAPKKSLGQNFLVDKNIILKTVGELDLSADDFVLEIGPGEGALTEQILTKCSNLLAVEIDQRACDILVRKFANSTHPDFKILNKDFLQFDFINDLPEIFKAKRIKILGNIPYYISGRIFFKLFENAEYISRAVITEQKEVAERIIAKPRTKDYGILSVLANLTCTARKAFDVSANCFYPKPNVTSSVVTLDFLPIEELPQNFKDVSEIVKSGFNQRRKMLSNSFKTYFESKSVRPETIAQINELYGHKRAEELVVKDFLNISYLLSENEGKK